MPSYSEKDFSQKNLHDVIPRFVRFYKDELGAKDKTGKSLITLVKNKEWLRYDIEFYYRNVRLALVMVKMESLEFDYEFFELVFSMPGGPNLEYDVIISV